MTSTELSETKKVLLNLFRGEWKSKNFAAARVYAKAHDEISKRMSDERNTKRVCVSG